MTIDRATVFRLAWVWAKQEAWSRRLPKGGAKGLFGECLRKAWAFHKSAAARAVASVNAFADLTTAQLRGNLIDLEDCDAPLGWERQERLSQVRRELYARA